MSRSLNNQQSRSLPFPSVAYPTCNLHNDDDDDHDGEAVHAVGDRVFDVDNGTIFRTFALSTYEAILFLSSQSFVFFPRHAHTSIHHDKMYITGDYYNGISKQGGLMNYMLGNVSGSTSDNPSSSSYYNSSASGASGGGGGSGSGAGAGAGGSGQGQSGGGNQQNQQQVRPKG